MLAKFWRGLGVGTIVLAMASPAWAVIYTFDNFLNGGNDFSVTSDGQTATFSSSSGPGTFTVNPSADIFSFPLALGGFGSFSGDPLTITFSDPAVDQIIIPFGVFEAYAVAPVTMVATANTGQSVQFNTAFYNLITGSPEGVIDFVPTGPVSALTLTSSLAFAIASVEVMTPTLTPTSAPTSTQVSEPMSAALLGGGLVIMAVLRRRTGLVGRRPN